MADKKVSEFTLTSSILGNYRFPFIIPNNTENYTTTATVLKNYILSDFNVRYSVFFNSSDILTSESTVQNFNDNLEKTIQLPEEEDGKLRIFSNTNASEEIFITTIYGAGFSNVTLMPNSSITFLRVAGKWVIQCHYQAIIS